jgi:peptidoglycan/LPS O-acetylase OafA/YrhL
LTAQRASNTLRLSTAHFPSLDGLRGMAILFVMLYHFHFVFRDDSGFGYWIFRVFNFGWCGVDLFFVLSGFLITGILLDAKGRTGYFRNFYIRRALRIFPLYYLFLLAVIGLLYPFSSRSLHFGPWTFWYLTYLSNWKENHGFGDLFLSHLWSLAVEEQFYLVWPLAIWITPKRGFPVVCVSAIVTAPVLRFAMLAHGSDAESIYRLTLTRMDALAMGALVAWLFRSHYWLLLKKNAALVALISLLGVAITFTVDQGPEWGGLIITFGDSLLILLFASVVVLCIRESSLAAWLSISWIRQLGRYSYSMYLFQEIVTLGFTPKILRFAEGSSSPFVIKLLFIPAAMAVTFVCGVLSWKLLEQRVLVLKDRLAPRTSEDLRVHAAI